MKKAVEFQARMVDLAAIDLSPGPCCMSFGFDLDPLMASIREVGLINPPLLYEKGNGEFGVIIGYRRLLALTSLGRGRVDCRIIKQPGPPMLDCLLLNLHDNLAIRAFNDVEKAMVLTRLLRHISPGEVFERYMPLLGLPPRQETLDFYTAVEEGLDDTIKTAFAHGRLSPDSAVGLLQLDEVDREALFFVIDNLNFNFNEQKNIIEYTEELVRINTSTIHDVLETTECRNILEGDTVNIPLRKKALMKYLREQRYPELTKVEAGFRQTLAKLALPKEARIVAPPFFESPDYRLEVRFKKGDDLRTVLNNLLRIEGLEKMGDPWEKDR